MMKEKQKTNRVLTIVLILGTVTVFFPLYMAAIIAFKKPSEMTTMWRVHFLSRNNGVLKTSVRQWK